MTASASLSLSQRVLRWSLAVLLIVLVPLLSGCDDESLMAPDVEDDRFRSVVTLGNSITAGFQSGGISATTQRESYAVLVAQQMRTPFNIPTLSEPGCPPPAQEFLGLFSGGGGGLNCRFRETPIPTVLNNLAVPGAQVADATTNLPSEGASPNPLTTFVLGGRTQVEAAADADPTFAISWLGNNDALGAALSGDPNQLTSVDAFRTQARAAWDALEDAGVEGGVIVEVANPLFTPALFPGPVVKAAEPNVNALGSSLSDAWGSITVADTCGPMGVGAQTRVPLGYFFGELFAQAINGADVTVDCDPATAADPLLTKGEQDVIAARVQDYNAIQAEIASNRSLATVAINPVLEAIYVAGSGTPADPSDDLVRKFPDPQAGPEAFGPFFSVDGVHPSANAHRVVANVVIQAINDEYGTTLPRVGLDGVPSIPGLEL